MKERPILFSGAMVRAILDGRKTQTRRIVKPQPELLREGFDGWRWKDERVDTLADLSPYGQPGDRLWVKETWLTTRGLDHCKPTDLVEGVPIEYVADGWLKGFGLHDKGKTRVSLFMRRWMSRITLKIVNVRVERLQDISEQDARNEGVSIAECFMEPVEQAGRVVFQRLWESLNGPGSWNANPWVWVLTFKRL